MIRPTVVVATLLATLAATVAWGQSAPASVDETVVKLSRYVVTGSNIPSPKYRPRRVHCTRINSDGTAARRALVTLDSSLRSE